MAKRFRVTLELFERDELEQLVKYGKADKRRLTHAKILLHADESAWGPALPDIEVADTCGTSVPTIERTRKRFVEEGLENALSPYKTPKNRYSPKLDGEQEAKLIAIACSTPPDGHARWSLRLLADKMVELEYVDELSHETVRQTLKKTNSSRI